MPAPYKPQTDDSNKTPGAGLIVFGFILFIGALIAKNEAAAIAGIVLIILPKALVVLARLFAGSGKKRR